MPRVPLLTRLPMDPSLNNGEDLSTEVVTALDQLATDVATILDGLPEPIWQRPRPAAAAAGGWATPGPGSFEV